MNAFYLERFVQAQHSMDYRTKKRMYDLALSEIRAGSKQSHWIWYIFPQVAGLGSSSNCARYGIRGIEEARAYLRHSELRHNLLEISESLLQLESSDPYSVMGYPDNLKLCSSMTLFAEADPTCEVFQRVLDKFFGGQKDKETLNILQRKSAW